MLPTTSAPTTSTQPTHTDKQTRSHTYADLIEMQPNNGGYQMQAQQAHNVEGGANMAGNGDDGGGGSICDIFCAAFCKDNPLAEAFGFNQPPENNGGGGGGGGGGPNYPGGNYGGGGGGGFAPPPGGGFAGPPYGGAPDNYNNGGQSMPMQPITSQSKHTQTTTNQSLRSAHNRRRPSV